jgi:capsid protein
MSRHSRKKAGFQSAIQRVAKPESRKNASRRYDAAPTTPENAAHWSQATPWNADMELSPAVRAKLRERARYECMNNVWLQGMLHTQAQDLIGTGPRLQILSPANDEALQKAEAAFQEWSRLTRFARKLCIARMTQSRDGEAFIILATNPSLPGVKLDTMLLDAERVTSPVTDSDTDDDNQADGVYFDGLGNPVRYSVQRTHPSVSGGLGPSLTIPASMMVHLFRAERPEQHRGASELAAALPLLSLLRRYTLAMVKKMETSANISGVLRTTDFEPGEGDELDPWKPFALPRDSFVALPRGYELTQYNLQNPTETQQSFATQVKCECARCLGLPRNVALGDSSGYNYASGRLDFQEYDKFLALAREDLAVSCLDKILATWWAEYDPFTPVPAHSWHWDGRAHVDPVKEASAETIRLTNKTLTLADACAAEGKDWLNVLRQRLKEEAEELRIRKELGLPPPASAASPAESPATKDTDEQ